ncbi:MAG: DEAD/DEAH box helicase [Cyclobacteriaceae bacterium]|nr:DEAD/DEAH box helicase [Cyclobacteriaceae bacterium HetDA_MAG_MS6]
MNIFDIHKDILSDYKNYINSFINIKDGRISEKVEEEMSKGVLCPEPLVQFNPSFKFDETLEQLCLRGILHEELNQIFAGFQLYKHQVEALEKGSKREDFVVTSGTGSGKSLTYIGTIFNSILRGKRDKKGIKAIIVYPMNALINSQSEELKKFKENYGNNFPITYQQYTGQEGADIRDHVRQNPPDILLTNYMMLELIMTRATEVDRAIRKSIKQHLKTLVFDEMHTYKGRQGSDVAMLIRRIKAFVDNDIQCIGTSATMSSGTGSREEQKTEVAEVASNLFGSKFNQDQIISETLTRVTKWEKGLLKKLSLKEALTNEIDVSANEIALHNHPLAIWLENRIGLEEEDGWLKRRNPISLPEIITTLSSESGEPENRCAEQLNKLLTWSENINKNLTEQNLRKAYFPFRLHQFISQTGSVFVTLENRHKRSIQLNPGYFIQSEEFDKQRIYPVVFSRITGHEFICVKKNYSTDTLEPRSFRDAYDEDESTQSGYIILEDVEHAPLWDDTMIENLPDSWYRTLKNGTVRIDKKYVNRIPSRIYFNALGQFSDQQPLLDSDPNIKAWFMPAKLIFDPTCFAFYDLKTSESAKLMTLGNEGRSTATTILSLASVKNLAKARIPQQDQKLLSFTDNRQDASLQAGHFNDFVNIGLIRSAIFNALKQADEHTLNIHTIGQKVAKVLNLSQEEYAQEPGKFSGAKRENEEALVDYLTIRILQDLKRGWRYTMPNLEQCALLKISYKYLDEEVENQEAWDDIPFLSGFTPQQRFEFIENTLDFFRTSSAIHHRFFFNERRIIESKIKSKLIQEWGFSPGETIPFPNYLRFESVGKIYQRGIFTQSIGKQSAWGKYASKQLSPDDKISVDVFLEFCRSYFKRLQEMGFLSSEIIKGEKGETTAYLLKADFIKWKLGDYKTVKHDKVRIRTQSEIQLEPNSYFQDYYRHNTSDLKYIKAAEHTGQIKNELRKERESQFREGALSTLFCSPTMELGIDISNLNIVHMRNAPPNPANYAQRSGRAGRSGQGALVITYCSQFSPHDRNYFKNKLQMVSGIVLPPRIPLDNEELIQSHLQAMYFLETGIDFRKSITEVIDERDLINLPIKQEIAIKIKDGHEQRKTIIMGYVRKMLQIDEKLSELIDIDTAEKILDNAPNRFDNAFKRWRRLYNNALKLRDASRAIIDNPIYASNSDEKKQAERSESFAKKQLIQLRNDDSGNSFSEFYPFRYLASEGFLPGYNFTKLPLRVAINGYETSEYLSRPRLIALQEFGPKNIIYHNGQSYEIKRISTSDIEKNLNETKAKVAKNSGYFFIGEEYERETCPISGENLSGQDDYIISNLLEMNESSAEIRKRITSEEEERMRLGYDIRTYFSLPKGTAANDNIVIKSNNDSLLKIMYMPTAKIISVNKKWNRSNRDSFLIDKRFGYWKRESDLEKDEDNKILPVSLYTDYNADALYIQPLKNLNLNEEQIVTLQFALKRAIEEVFQIEPSELAVTMMGEGEASNIFLFESSEGSLGVLSQFAKDERIFRHVVQKAYEICHFENGEDIKPEVGPASYEDLLNYYNQRYHEQIDRHEIKLALENLMECRVEIQLKASGDYDTQYQELIKRYDERSSTEHTFLRYLYDNGLRLPDKAQPKLSEKFGLYVMPDFQYGDKTFIFCDGTPHDDPDTRERDRKQRKAMRKAGLRYIVFYYKDSLEDIIKINKDIFIKVR